MEEMAARISGALIQGKKVLWLICGGSNIPTAVEAMKSIKHSVPADKLSLLTVGQTDERYGPIGHPDSNWKQMQDDGFDFDGVRFVPILVGKPLHETVAEYERAIAPIMDDTLASGGLIVGHFGMGADGHIAGMLPHTPAVNDSRAVSGYEGAPFTRVTLTPPSLRKISAAYAFVFGASKRDAVRHLRDQDLSLDEEPAQILKELPDAQLYSDQL